MPMTNEQAGKVLRQFRTQPSDFTPEQQLSLAQVQGRLLAADAVGKAHTVKAQTAKVKASAHRAEMHAKAELEAALADIQQRAEGIPEGDEVAVATLNLEKAKALAAYRPIHLALQQASDEQADAERDYQAATAEEQRLG